jgi:soluble lytic murein transglycosylase-like protein
MGMLSSLLLGAIQPTADEEWRGDYAEMVKAMTPSPVKELASADEDFSGWEDGARLSEAVSPGGPPELSMAADRKRSIVNDLPARFRLADSRDASGDAPWYENAGAGRSAVERNNDFIEQSASKYGVDPDLVRAVMFMETSHGWYDAVPALFDKNKTVLPMNVHSEYWTDLGYSREQLKDPALNVEAGTLLLKRISDRVVSPTIERVATVYQFVGAEKVTDYGARVGATYQTKPWLRPSPEPELYPPMP